MSMHITDSSMFLAVDLAVITLAVVTRAVGPLHSAASARPTRVVVLAFQCSLADAMVAIRAFSTCYKAENCQ